MHLYWDQEGGQVKWPSKAGTVELLNFACWFVFVCLFPVISCGSGCIYFFLYISTFVNVHICGYVAQSGSAIPGVCMAMCRIGGPESRALSQHRRNKQTYKFTRTGCSGGLSSVDNCVCASCVCNCEMPFSWRLFFLFSHLHLGNTGHMSYTLYSTVMSKVSYRF